MDFSEIVASRQSCRNFDETRMIEDEKLQAILSNARFSPSACNGQPYFLTVCKGEKAKQVAKATMGMGMNKFTTSAPVQIVISEMPYVKTAALGAKLKGNDYRSIDIGIVAAYITAHNDDYIYFVESKYPGSSDYSMMTMDSNKEVYDILNNAIKDMKADGTLDSLISNELKAYIESDPEAKDLPKFDGARTIKIGVTGDVPPMDYVAANGKAAGFNIALLTEIANRAQVNIELVQIDSAARATALSTEKVDAVFWAKSVSCDSCDNAVFAEEIEGTLVTETYFCAATAVLMPKSDK